MLQNVFSSPCSKNKSSFLILLGGSKNCLLRPFQLIPYDQMETATKFSDIDNKKLLMKSCTLTKALEKFPDNAREMKLQWLDQSYVDLNVSNNNMYFKVSK
jgi:hypothetical protein